MADTLALRFDTTPDYQKVTLLLIGTTDRGESYTKESTVYAVSSAMLPSISATYAVGLVIAEAEGASEGYKFITTRMPMYV